jgi:hypothetical protein
MLECGAGPWQEAIHNNFSYQQCSDYQRCHAPFVRTRQR